MITEDELDRLEAMARTQPPASQSHQEDVRELTVDRRTPWVRNAAAERWDASFAGYFICVRENPRGGADWMVVRDHLAEGSGREDTGREAAHAALLWVWVDRYDRLLVGVPDGWDEWEKDYEKTKGKFSLWPWEDGELGPETVLQASDVIAPYREAILRLSAEVRRLRKELDGVFYG